MATKFTAAQLRGLKLEHEKEIRDKTINLVCIAISSLIQTYAKKGETKLIITFTEGVIGFKMIYPERGSGGTNYYRADADFIKDCCSNLSSTYIDSVITDTIEVDKKSTIHKITIDWSGISPEEKDKEVNELDILRAKIAELEAENTRLKAPSTVGAITNDLIDIFANFGKIN